jgi:hypothetical protein
LTIDFDKDTLANSFAAMDPASFDQQRPRPQ